MSFMIPPDLIANETPDADKLERAIRIITALQNEVPDYIARGSGPFLAALYDDAGHLVAKEANSVVQEGCSHCHAEMNTLRTAQKKLGTYNLGPHHLSLYITAEPCLMCLGGIMWSGVQTVYYGVPSARVEALTGFDEGYKPDWHKAFRQRGITVYGNIAVAVGEQVLIDYVNQGRIIYKPDR